MELKRVHRLSMSAMSSQSIQTTKPLVERIFNIVVLYLQYLVKNFAIGGSNAWGNGVPHLSLKASQTCPCVYKSFECSVGCLRFNLQRYIGRVCVCKEILLHRALDVVV